MTEITRDAFLGGRLTICQPRRGYRAGVDPVLLAASVPARAGDQVLELGCGVGTASLCLGARVPGVDLTGLELQPDYADLARQNAHENQLALRVLTGDLTSMPSELRERQFHHVIANPPYYQRQAGTAAQDQGREIALGGETPLAIWVQSAAKRAAPKGYVTFIQRADRLPELLSEMRLYLGSLQLLPLLPRSGREAQLVLVRGRKQGRADFRLMAPVVMHQGMSHEKDAESYCPEIRAVLRDGAGLKFPL